MNAQEILDEIRMLGGSLEARGDRLHVEAPKGALKPEHREALAALKPELLALLQQKRGGGELEASRRRLESAGVSIAVWEDGSMRVLVSEADTLGAIKDGGTIYSPADMWHYVRLEPDERRMLHEFKKRFGGTTEWKMAMNSKQAFKCTPHAAGRSGSAKKCERCGKPALIVRPCPGIHGTFLAFISKRAPYDCVHLPV